ncbi:ATP-binding protein [Pleurocapsales cyanobacterium LEGE 10410]|nr:ATP-binding protein [Pleurocapsales cyanobacterium LEGE 10410]
MKPLIVAGELESLTEIAQFVIKATQKASLDKKAAYLLRLAVDEIATNIITHGYKQAGLAGKIYCQAKINENALIIILEDTGVIYNPLQQEKPNSLHKPLEQRVVGGLGVYLAIQSVDKFRYERLGERNRNIFIVYSQASQKSLFYDQNSRA